MGNNISTYCSPQLHQYPWYPADESNNRRMATSAFISHFNITCFHCENITEHVYTTSIETIQGETFRRVFHFCTKCRRKSTCEQVANANEAHLEVFHTFVLLLAEKEQEEEKKEKEKGKGAKAEERTASRRAPTIRTTNNRANPANRSPPATEDEFSSGSSFWGC